jgi:predicted homoserine dehydrogenase-like protein
VLAGNIKGMLDHYRTPATQRRFAEANKQSPKMVTSFADGTKLSFEMAVVANATGFGVAKRGMYGPACAHANDAPGMFPCEDLLSGGIVDYILGAEPGPGVFVLGYSEDPIKRQYMEYFKMGPGPFYTFYTPYHLPHVETPVTVARAVLFKDAAITPLGAPICEVPTIAKRELRAGEVLDGFGGFLSYGTIENYSICRRDDLLPMGLSDGCVIRRDVPKDAPISYADVQLPAARLCDRLREEQNAYFAGRLTGTN